MDIRRYALLVCLLLASCAWPPIGEHERVEGWPELKVVARNVPHKVFRDVCAPGTSWYLEAQACASFDFRNGTCFIWTSADFPPTKHVLEHERLHCAGFDHVGSTVMATMLQRHLARSEQLARLPQPPAP